MHAKKFIRRQRRFERDTGTDIAAIRAPPQPFNGETRSKWGGALTLRLHGSREEARPEPSDSGRGLCEARPTEEGTLASFV
jgi:hypothetical protein